MAKNKYREAHPEWFDEKGRVKPELLRELIDYNHETGELRWKKRGEIFFASSRRSSASEAGIWNKRYCGKDAGSIGATDGWNYVSVRIFGRCYSGLSIAHVMINGLWCDGNISAVDDDGTNLRSINISTKSDASSNKNKSRGFFRTDGVSRYTGVSFKNETGKWIASIGINKKFLLLGYFKSEVDAADAYDRAAIKYFGPSTMINAAARPEPVPEKKPKPASKAGCPQKINRRFLKARGPLPGSFRWRAFHSDLP